MKSTLTTLVLSAMIAASAQTVDERLSRWRPVKMPFDASGLSARERKLVETLVDASQYVEQIFWRQSDPEGLKLFKSLELSTDGRGQNLRRLLMIMGSRFDLLDHNENFAGSERMTLGRGLYPEGITAQRIAHYVKQHPEKRDEVYSPYTIVRRRDSELVGIPYRVWFRELLEPAAKALQEAAGLSEDPKFARFLAMRADALLKDDYYESDLAWLELENPKFDVIFGPYETYLDEVLGVKTSFEAAVLIRNDVESRKLAMYQRYVPEIQDALPLAAADRPSKRGHASPMEVVDSPFRAGDLRHGYQAVAVNLPNDPKIHQLKGTKKIFFKNFMDARVSEVILPLAQRLMRPDQAARVSGQGYMADVLLHEIAHGLGPVYARAGGKQVDIREAIGPIYSALEEAKADITGMFGLKWLVDRGTLPKEDLDGYYASFLAGIFRTLRYGTEEAHGLAQIMEFNYLSGQKAIVRDPGSGRYYVDAARMPPAIALLARELLEIEATGDRTRAQRWFARYRRVPASLRAALAAARDIPVDIEPVFSFEDHIL